jgi:hypothetical protein
MYATGLLECVYANSVIHSQINDLTSHLWQWPKTTNRVDYYVNRRSHPNCQRGGEHIDPASYQGTLSNPELLKDLGW